MDTEKSQALARLKKIQGQVRGLEKMVQDGRYCIDILDQVASVKSALDGVGLQLMRGHIQTCVSSAIQAGKGVKAIDELMVSLDRLVR